MDARVFRSLLRLSPIPLLLLLSGCSTQHFWLFHPEGPIAGTEMRLMGIDVLILLVIIVPTTFLLVWIIARYRASRTDTTYAPNWSHSTKIEWAVWGIPVVTVVILSFIAYKGIRQVDPYNPTVLHNASTAQPLTVDVITTDWKWLFIYPKQNIATVNRLVVPTNTPIHFNLTSATVTNSIFIPRLVGQIYVMPGMRTKQRMLVHTAGTYHGFSALQSGPGFSWMRFKTNAVSQKAFETWVQAKQHGNRDLTFAAFDKLAKPTVDTHDKTAYYAQVQAGLFRHVIEEVKHGKVFPTHWAMTEHM